MHTGAVKLKLDDFSTKVAIFDVHWQSEGALEAKDRFDLDVSSGVVDLKLDSYTPKSTGTIPLQSPPEPVGEAASAIDILLDGVEVRIRSRH